MQAGFLTAAVLAVTVAVLAGPAERRRQARRHVAGVGFMPWSGITVTMLFAAAMCVGLGLRG